MLPTTRAFGMAVLAGTVLGPGLAEAQAPPNAKPKPAREKKVDGPKNCVETRATTGGVETRAPKGRALSQQLARANGVICPPPHTDPEMTKPAPGGGTMRVIPPPGSDKNRPGIAPK